MLLRILLLTQVSRLLACRALDTLVPPTTPAPLPQMRMLAIALVNSVMPLLIKLRPQEKDYGGGRLGVKDKVEREQF